MDFVSWHCLSTQHFYEVEYPPRVLILLCESLSYSQAKKFFLKESYFESLKAFKQWNGNTYWEEVLKIIFSDLFRHGKITGMCYKVRRRFEIDHSHWSLLTQHIYITEIFQWILAFLVSHFFSNVTFLLDSSDALMSVLLSCCTTMFLRFLQCKSMTAGVPSHRFSRIPVMNSGTSTGLQMALLRTRWCTMGESSACQLGQYSIWSYEEVFRQSVDTYVCLIKSLFQKKLQCCIINRF